MLDKRRVHGAFSISSPTCCCCTRPAIWSASTPPIPNRIQALDLGGNDVRYFTGQVQPFFLTLDATPSTAGWVHLASLGEPAGADAVVHGVNCTA